MISLLIDNAKLKAAREDALLSVIELAELSGLHLNTLRRLESTITNAQMGTVRRLCEALGVTPADIRYQERENRR